MSSKRPRSPAPPSPSKRRPSTTAASSVPPKIRLLCDILATTPLPSLDLTLSSSAPSLTSSDVEHVLRLSYSHPAAAVKFFHWASSRLPHPPSPYSWNLAVDLLGKNRLFDAMWGTIASMRPLRALSLATFASVFSSYAAAKDFSSALRAFDQMQSLHGVPRDAAALNCLLSAICREGRSDVASDFLRLRRHEVPPDGDSYAILLEGWENEGDAARAREVFDEMVQTVGWDPKNYPAYDSFLCTLVRGSGIKDAMKYLNVLKERRCCPGMKFFRAAVDELVKAEDARGAVSLWETLVGRNGCYPDVKMYYSMIKLQCYDNQTDSAMKYLDEMVIYGAFPDANIYNVLLHYLLKWRKMRDWAAIFDEMVKNEFVPIEEDCASAIRVLLDGKDWETGIKVWKCMVENRYSVEEIGNMLVGKLKDIDRLPEACKFAEDMIDRRVKLNSASLTKLRTSLLNVGKGNIYDHILRKWKLRV